MSGFELGNKTMLASAYVEVHQQTIPLFLSSATLSFPTFLCHSSFPMAAFLPFYAWSPFAPKALFFYLSVKY